MARKSRDPRDLSRDDLVTWSQDLCMFLVDHAGDIDLTPRAADFPPLAAAYEDAYHAAIDPKQYSPLLHDEVEKIAESLEEILRELRGRIPLIPGNDETVLAHFGLGEPVPTDWDELDAVAQVCEEYWKSLADPPEYAPIKPRMDEMSTLVKLFDAKHSAYRASIGDKQDAVNLRERRRADLLVCERLIFNWYYAAHPKGGDDWWRTTPWGETPKGKDEPFPAPAKLMYDYFRNDFTWNPVEKATGYELEVKNKLTQETSIFKTELNQKRVPLEKGDYITKVRAVKEASDAEYSKWSGDVPFTVKPAPDKFKYNPGLKELSWDSVAGANTYEVRKDGSFGFEYLGPDTKFVLDLPAGQYKFRVRGGDDMANWWSEWSEILSVTV